MAYSNYESDSYMQERIRSRDQHLAEEKAKRENARLEKIRLIRSGLASQHFAQQMFVAACGLNDFSVEKTMEQIVEALKIMDLEGKIDVVA